MMINASKQVLDYVALSVSGTLKRQTEAITNAIKRGNNSLIKAGRASTISFPVIVSNDIDESVAYDIGKDAETILAMATKNFLEKKVKRDASELDIDDIIATLPIFNPTQSVMDIHDMSKALIDEACHVASALVDEGIKNNQIIAEASNIEVLREKGSNGTYIKIQLPYITRSRDGKGGEIKTLDVVMEFDAVIRSVSASELVERINHFDTNRFYKSFIKLTNKEIKFAHDFLFDLDRLKMEAKDSAKGSKLFKDLTLRNKSKSLFLSSYPYTVLVFSDAVSMDILEKYHIDMQIPRHATGLMDSFAAFSIYLVNTSNNIVDIYRDGDAEKKSIPLDDLTKASSKIDRKLKELIKLG